MSGDEPAFLRPQSETSLGGNFEQDGMSKRDWFAGQALASMGAWMPDYEPDGSKVEAVKNLCNPAMQRARARWACSQADALLAELARGRDDG